MKNEIINKDSIKIIGIELRTTNENNQAVKDISQFWEKFYVENIKDRIPNKIDDEILGLYIDYEGDFTKPYSLIICCKVSTFDEIPKGMVAKIIPAAKYVVFTAKGKMPGKLLETWQYVWNSDLDRTYTGDFEIYGQKFGNPEDSEVDVYIAVQ